MMSPDFHRDLVERLVANAAPVRRLWPVGVRLGLWNLMAAALVTGLAWLRARPDLAPRLSEPLFLGHITLLLAAACLAAALALRAAIPGRGPSPGASVLAGLPIASVGVLLVAMPAGAGWTLGQFVAGGAPCAAQTFAIAALPCLVLLLAVRRGAPLAAATAGALAGAAATSLAAATVRVICPADEPLHILAWHLAPIAVGVTASAALALAWLRRWRRG